MKYYTIGLILLCILILVLIFHKYSFSLQIEGYTSVPPKIGYAYGQLAPILQQKLNFPTEHNLTAQALFIENYLVPMYNNKDIDKNNIENAKQLIDVLSSFKLKFDWDTNKNTLYVAMDYLLKNNYKIGDLFKISTILDIFSKDGEINKNTMEKYDKLMEKLMAVPTNFTGIIREMQAKGIITIAQDNGIKLDEMGKMEKLMCVLTTFDVNPPNDDKYMEFMKLTKFVDLTIPFDDYFESMKGSKEDYEKISKIIKKENILSDYLKSNRKITDYLYIIIPNISDEDYKTLLNTEKMDINKKNNLDKHVTTITKNIQTSIQNKNKQFLQNFNSLDKKSIEALKDNITVAILISIFPYSFLNEIHSHILKWKGEDKKIICDPNNPLNIRMTNMNAVTTQPSLQHEQSVKYAALCK